MTRWVVAEPGRIPGSCVWRIGLTREPAALARCDGLLSPEERAAAARFQRAQDRDRYRASHAALRLILGRALGRDPAALAFERGPGGKPILADAPGGPFDFNLSHSGAQALVGLSTEARIGVDLELCRPLPDALRIARSHFAADEAAALAACHATARQAAFLALWTCKEAVVKALGDGLARPLDSFSVTLALASPTLLRMADGPQAWTLDRLDLGTGSVGAVALDAGAIALHFHALPADWPTRLP